MNGFTLTEKIMARAAGLPGVRPEDEIWANADRMIMNDSSGPRRIAELVAELGGVRDPERAILVSDHFVPAANVRHAAILKATRAWAHQNEVPHFYEYQGILHSLVLERRLVDPGMLLVGADSHTTTAGAMGAMAVAVGSTELATVLATGQVWLRVPDTIRIDLVGQLGPRVDVRDVTLRLLGDHGTEFALYRALEFGGSMIEALTLEERLIFANQGIEMGAKNAVVVPTGRLEAELGRNNTHWTPDADARYLERFRYDVSGLSPLVALHPSPDRVVPAREVAGLALDMAWLGSCAGGRYADLVAAAEVVAGKKVQIPFLVTPATREIERRAMREGILETLLEAGATLLSPGCGACAGVHGGVQGAGDRVIATATRNFQGRMGSTEAEVLIGSAYTVAASAVVGRVADPRESA